MAEKQAKRILTASEIENIHKMPTARLTRKLAELGFTDEQLDLMDRKELIHTWSTAVADGGDKSVSKLTAEQPRALMLDPTIAEKQLEFERFKFEQEIKMRQQQLDAECAREMHVCSY